MPVAPGHQLDAPRTLACANLEPKLRVQPTCHKSVRQDQAQHTVRLGGALGYVVTRVRNTSASRTASCANPTHNPASAERAARAAFDPLASRRLHISIPQPTH